MALQLGLSGLSGRMPGPPWLALAPSLLYIDLQSNDITGPIPPQLGNATHLRALFINDNAFDGALPPALGSLKELAYLNVANNELTGPVPASFAHAEALEWFVASSNCLVSVAAGCACGRRGGWHCPARPEADRWGAGARRGSSARRHVAHACGWLSTAWELESAWQAAWAEANA